MEQSVPAVAVTSAGKQETTACAAGEGPADRRIYKKENLQILTIFVKLSVVHFKQQWLCSHKEIIFFLLLPSQEALCLGPGMFLGLADAPSPDGQCRLREGLRGVLRGDFVHTLIYEWRNCT